MFTPEMLESIKKVEATRDERMGMEPRRMTADEKDALLKAYHPDYREDGFAEIKIGPNKGQKAPTELGSLLHSNSRLLNVDIDLNKVDYDVDVLVIGGGGAGSSAAIEAHEAGANVMIVTKLRIGDANTMMAEGGIQAADKENDSPVQHYLDAFGGGHFAARPELLKRLVMEAPDAIKWLNELGVMFDKDAEGNMVTTHGGGTSRKRMHACKDYSGAEIMRTLRDEVLNHLNNRGAGAGVPEEGGEEALLRLGHIGFYNVDTIIRLHYGAEYGLSVCRPEGGGTKVTIMIPVRQGEELCDA